MALNSIHPAKVAAPPQQTTSVSVSNYIKMRIYEIGICRVVLSDTYLDSNELSSYQIRA